jgi:YggT family protein
MNPLILIIRLIFSLYIYCIILHILFEQIKLDHKNPLFRSIAKITNPALVYIKKFLPKSLSPKVGLLILLTVSVLAKLLVISLLGGLWPNLWGLIGWAFFDCLAQLITLYTYLFFIQIIFSWLMPHQSSLISYAIYALTYPVLIKFRHYIPMIKGFDLSPLIAIIVSQLINSFIVNPLNQTLMQWALY